MIGCKTCESHTGWPGYLRFVAGTGLGHNEKAHRIYEKLWRGGVRSAEHFHALDELALLGVGGLGPMKVAYILENRAWPEHMPPETAVGLLHRAAALAARMDAPWARALAEALRAARDNHQYCQRVNARRPQGPLELPDLTAEELAKTAALLVESHIATTRTADETKEARHADPCTTGH